MKCLKMFLLFLAAFVITSVSAKDDYVPAVHRDIHKQLQSLQLESQNFQSMVDSVNSISGDAVEEVFDLFPALDLYSNWNTSEKGPLFDISGPIPATSDIDVSGFVAPIQGRITSPFGWRRRRMHKGVDIKLYIGDTVRAAFDGRVSVRRFERRGYGYYYVIRHTNGLETVYGHLSRQIVPQDAYVKAGQAIGLGGSTGRSTGPHLHFEMRFKGIALDPSDIVDFDSFKPKSPIYAFRKNRAEWAQANKGKRGARFTESSARENVTISSTATKEKSPASTNQQNQKNIRGNVHRVKKGDTLSNIARRYGTTVSKLCKLNNIKANKTLQLGQTIKYR